MKHPQMGIWAWCWKDWAVSVWDKARYLQWSSGGNSAPCWSRATLQPLEQWFQVQQVFHAFCFKSLSAGGGTTYPQRMCSLQLSLEEENGKREHLGKKAASRSGCRCPAGSVRGAAGHGVVPMSLCPPTAPAVLCGPCGCATGTPSQQGGIWGRGSPQLGSQPRLFWTAKHPYR